MSGKSNRAVIIKQIKKASECVEQALNHLHVAHAVSQQHPKFHETGLDEISNFLFEARDTLQAISDIW